MRKNIVDVVVYLKWFESIRLFKVKTLSVEDASYTKTEIKKGFPT